MKKNVVIGLGVVGLWSGLLLLFNLGWKSMLRNPIWYTYQTLAQGKDPAMHKGMINPAKIMASTTTT